jgi:hypothetical protein
MIFKPKLTIHFVFHFFISYESFFYKMILARSRLSRTRKFAAQIAREFGLTDGAKNRSFRLPGEARRARRRRVLAFQQASGACAALGRHGGLGRARARAEAAPPIVFEVLLKPIAHSAGGKSNADPGNLNADSQTIRQTKRGFRPFKHGSWPFKRGCEEAVRFAPLFSLCSYEYTNRASRMSGWRRIKRGWGRIERVWRPIKRGWRRIKRGLNPAAAGVGEPC